MTCYSPLLGWYSRDKNENGKRSIVFNPRQGYADMPVRVNCGKCIGCRLDKSREWALRCVHEASLYDYNCFVTLTYDDEHLPEGCSLVKAHLQKFMKRLRKKYVGKSGIGNFGIRYFCCGEYGSVSFRPHYHLALFGFDFTDKKIYKETSAGNICTSEELKSLWPYGFSTVADLTYQSCAYVARYVIKKQNENKKINEKVQSEYITMSNRPGIGYKWFDKFKSDVFPDDFIVYNNKKQKPPRYYTE